MLSVKKRIGIWGDSILKGIVLDEHAGKYCILNDNCVSLAREQLGIEVLNRSRFGCTISKGQRMLDQALDRSIDYDAVLLEYGGNDCDFDWPAVAESPNQPHQPATPLSEFIRILQEMIRKLQQHQIKPILMSLPPIHSERYFNFLVDRGVYSQGLLQFLGDVRQIYQHHEAYSLAVTRLAFQHQCYYLPVREAFLSSGQSTQLLCLDGIHPNARGHELMQNVFAHFADQYEQAKLMT